jgi:hypothetical protein
MVYKRRGRRGGQDGDYDDDTTTTSSPMTTANDMPESDDNTSSATQTMGGRRRSKRGGTGGVASSAATYAMNTAGNGQTQWNNVFNNSETMNAYTGNGLWSTDLTKNVSGGIRPLDTTLGSLMQGGRKGRRKRTRRGGNLLDVVGQAAVPFGLMALQQAYSKRTGKKGGRKSKRTRKSGGRRKSRRHVRGFGPL